MTAADELLLDSPAERPCTHRREHQHGTRQRYDSDRCRCQRCRDAIAAYRRWQRRQAAYGRWSAWLDAAPVRAWTRDVMAAESITAVEVARRAALSVGTVNRLLYGLNGGPPAVRVRRRTAEQIYALPAGNRPAPRPALWTKEVSA